MSRPLRIEYPGAWYHVMNRGLGRRAIFTDDEQRCYFLSLLAGASERFDADWHGYCLMGNHYHLLLRTPAGNLQRIMRHVNGVYTQYYNRAEGRDGPLFRGRYKAVLVDAEAYWRQLSRYIHRNPLEAGLVTVLGRYRWSSYPAYLGQVKRPAWLNCAYILSATARRNARARYRAYVESESEGDEAEAFYARRRHSPILGGEGFRRRLRPKGKAIDVPELRRARPRYGAWHIAAVVAKRLEVDEGLIWTSRRGPAGSNPARGMTMYLCQHVGGMKLAEIAEHFGLSHYASAGASIRQFKAKLSEDKRLREVANTIKLDLTP